MFFKKKKSYEGIMGINERNARYIYPNNPKKHYSLADDKIKSKQILHKHKIPCAETYAVIEGVRDIQSCWEKVAKSNNSIAIKPSKGFGGSGIKILRKNNTGNWISAKRKLKENEIFMHMANIIMGIYSFGSTDRVLIEECIEPHNFFHNIYAAGVPDFRIITFKSKPILSMLRMPTKKSKGKANLHQGGIGVGIDMERGLLTQAFDGKSYMDEHPDSNVLIAGREIPFWNETVEVAIQTAELFPLDYLGVDIVIDVNKGPMIMEVNVRPGLGIQLVNKVGLKDVIEKVG